MDLYDTSSRAGERSLGERANRLVTEHEAFVKYCLALAGVVASGFASRWVFETQLGQVFGAMLVWFSLLFGVAGVAFAGLFWARGKVAAYRRDTR